MNDMMMAAVQHGAKDLRVESCAVPKLRQGEVLIRVRQAGICGSDLHYFAHGYCGSFVPSRPFVLGHEAVGEVAAAAEDVKKPAQGTRVVLNPARACGFCDYCRSGRGNLCLRTVMLGSASTTPPTDGAFAQFVTIRADQCHVLPSNMDDALGTLMEPFAVALHAAKRAGTVAGKSVLVTGGGPIGLLVAMTARAFGALPVVVSDIAPDRRKKALTCGVDAVLDPAMPDFMDDIRQIVSDGFEVVFEASGASPALRQAFEAVRRGGTIVQIGTLGTADVPLPANQVMAREIQLMGSFRYGAVFDEAIRLANSGRIDLRPLVTRVFPLSQASEAMTVAGSRESVLKVQLQI